MSTFTAVGPAVALDGPLPVRPPHSLLSTPGVLASDDATRVLNGVNVWGYPKGCPNLWEPCSDGTFRVKLDESTMPVARFDSFVAYRPVTCSAIGFNNESALEFSDRAAVALDATLSGGVELALAQGVEGSSNPFFGDANVSDLTPTPGTGVSPGVGLSLAEEYLGDECRLGMIHATPAVVVALQAFPVGDTSDMRLITANGTPVVSGTGYQTVDTPFLPDPGTTEDYIFATGPPRVYLGPVVLTTVKETLDRSNNVLTFRAERYVLAYWDTAIQGAVLVDWSL